MIFSGIFREKDPDLSFIEDACVSEPGLSGFTRPLSPRQNLLALS